MIVLDTNVLSEAARPSPSPEVWQWFSSQIKTELFTTTVWEAEMLGGIAALDPGRRRDELARDFRLIFDEDFAGRILPFDSAAARALPSIVRRIRGKLMLGPDAQIAAIAHAHKAMLATRNIKHFTGRGIRLINPWTGEER